MTTIPQPGRRFNDPVAGGATVAPPTRIETRWKKSKKRPPRITFLGFIGEILITAGLFLLLFVVWELYYTNLIAARSQDAYQNQALDKFNDNMTVGFNGDGPDPSVPKEVDAKNGTWGFLYIPRFGDSFSVPIVDGTDQSIIDSGVVGRYKNSTRPGEVGNLSVAGHRQTYGAILWDLDKVVEGDKMYVQTANGFWVYEVRKNHIVKPSQVEVLDPNPLEPGEPSDEQFLTVTTCHPPYTTLERMVTHAVKVDFIPIEHGAPEEIAKAANKNLPEKYRAETVNGVDVDQFTLLADNDFPMKDRG